MNKALKDEISHDAGNGSVEFGTGAGPSAPSTDAHDAETPTFSLEIPDNESLEDAERDMDELIRSSFDNWDD